MIKIKNVSKSFGTKKVIQDMNLEIEDGLIFGFIGQNAAGKTTTINMITGATSITKGDIEIGGFSIKNDPINAKKKMGVVFDSPDQFLSMKVIDFWNFIGDAYDVETDVRKERIEELVKDFKIEEYINSYIQDLSHGTKQKVMIVAALLHDPEVWILDEPMTGLDPESSYILKEKMRQHAKAGKTVFFSSHVLEVVEKLCDKIAIIKQGKIIYVGTYDELKQKYPDTEDLEKLFIKITGGKSE